MRDWSRGAMPPPHHKPIDSSRVGTGQSSRRGRVRCQSLFIAWERRRCEPGSNSVIVTAPFTGCEGHVLRLGGVRRTRKIFVGCPAIRPIRDQSPGIRNPRLETVGNRLYPLHDQDCLRRGTAEAQIQDRSRKSTGLNTAPGFLRVFPSFPRTPPSFPRRREPRKKQSTPFCTPSFPRTPSSFPRTPPSFPRRREPREKQSTPFCTPSFPRTPPSFPRRREPREKQSTPFTPFHHPLSRSMGEGQGEGDTARPVIPTHTPVVPAEAGTQKKQSTPSSPLPLGGRGPG